MEIALIICGTVLVVTIIIAVLIWRENVDADLLIKAKNRQRVEDYQRGQRRKLELASKGESEK